MNKGNFIIIVLLISNIFLLGYFYFFELKSASAMCLNAPLEFGFKQLQEKNTDELVCSCNLISEYQSPTLHFNSTGRWFENRNNLGESGVPEINKINLTFAK